VREQRGNPTESRPRGGAGDGDGDRDRLARGLGGVAFALVRLVAVPGGVALLFVHLIGAVGVGLAVEHGGAARVTLIVLALGIAAAPVVGVDLKKPVVGGAVIVVVSGSAVEGRLPFGDAHHGADGVGREASVSQVPGDGTRALSRKIGLRGLDSRASRAGEDGRGKAGSICGGHAGRADCTTNAPRAGLG